MCHIITHVPADMADLKQKAQGYTNAGGECGGIMLHYADENFTFREGANRFTYISQTNLISRVVMHHGLS